MINLPMLTSKIPESRFGGTFLPLHIMRISLLSCLVLLLACNGDNSYKKAENAQDAGRELIRASLDGNYEKAEFYLLQDSTNRLLIGKWKKDYDHFDEATREQYKDANILPISIQNRNDSTVLYTFSNSYKKDTTTIKILRINGEWLVDLKEILNHKK
jgi:hypothetical protein